MGIWEYKSGQILDREANKLSGNPFYSLLQAAMREADSTNLEKLKSQWPEIWKELQARYNAPGGYLDGER